MCKNILFEFQVNKSNLEIFVHLEKGGAHRVSDEEKRYHALVRLSGYVARWSRNSTKKVGEPTCDEDCLPRKGAFNNYVDMSGYLGGWSGLSLCP